MSSDSYLLIDGQQRVTTTLIFLAAIRDTLKSLQISHNKIQDEKNNLLARINSFLFVNGDPKEPKLTPCYLDRKSFFGIIMSDEKSFLSEGETGINFSRYLVNIFCPINKAHLVYIKFSFYKICH